MFLPETHAGKAQSDPSQMLVEEGKGLGPLFSKARLPAYYVKACYLKESVNLTTQLVIAVALQQHACESFYIPCHVQLQATGFPTSVFCTDTKSMNEIYQDKG